MNQATLERRRHLALSEMWHLPKSIPGKDKAALREAADKATAALLQLAQEALGIAMAKFQHMTFAEPIDVSIKDVPIQSYEDLMSALNGASTVISSRADLSIAQTQFQSQQEEYGSMLVKGILNNYSGKINSVISSGIAAGQDREMIKDNLLSEVGVSQELMPEWRARLIAQTEVIGAYNGAAFANMKAVGADFVKWLDGQAGACEDCVALDGLIIPMGNGNAFAGAFSGETAEYPPLHPGCRCSIAEGTLEDYANQPQLDQAQYIDGASQDDYSNLKASSLPTAQELQKPTVAPEETAASAQSPTDFLKEMKFKPATLDAEAIQTMANLVGYTKAELLEAAKELGLSSEFPHPTAPNSEAFKKWYEESGSTSTGVKAMQEYSKATGIPMKDLSAAIKAEGYTVGTLVKAAGGELPAPDITVKPNAIGKTKPSPVVKLGEDLGLKSSFKNPEAPEPKSDYWNQMEKTGAAAGSNPGGFYTGPDGQKWYIKEYKNIAQAESEIFSQKIYDMLGIKTPDGFIIEMNGKQVYASKIVEGATSVSQAEVVKYLKEHPEFAAQLHVASVFTQNWDVIGQSWDNIMKLPSGELIVVDTGGTFLFRAQGGAKPYNSAATEFDTLLDMAANTSSKAFAGLYKDAASIDAGLTTARWLKQNLTQISWEAPDFLVLLGGQEALVAKIDSTIEKLEQRKAELNRPKFDIKNAPGYYDSNDLALMKSFADDALLRAEFGPGSYDLNAFHSVASEWNSSSGYDKPMIAKAVVQNAAHGTPLNQAYAEEKRRYVGGVATQAQMDGWKAEWDSRYASQANELKHTVLSAYYDAQDQLKALHPDGYVDLYRGVRGVARGFKDDFDSGIAHQYDQNALASFSTSKAIAMHSSFFSENDGIIIHVRVPIEMVYGSHQTGIGVIGESEYVVMAGPAGWILTPANVEVYLGGVKRYTEAPNRPHSDVFPDDWSVSDLAFKYWCMPADQIDFPRPSK